MATAWLIEDFEKFNGRLKKNEEQLRSLYEQDENSLKGSGVDKLHFLLSQYSDCNECVKAYLYFQDSPIAKEAYENATDTLYVLQSKAIGDTICKLVPTNELKSYIKKYPTEINELNSYLGHASLNSHVFALHKAQKHTQEITTQPDEKSQLRPSQRG